MIQFSTSKSLISLFYFLTVFLRWLFTGKVNDYCTCRFHTSGKSMLGKNAFLCPVSEKCLSCKILGKIWHMFTYIDASLSKDSSVL